MNLEEKIKAALATVKYPGYSRDIVSFGLIREIRTSGRHLDLTIELSTRDPKIAEALDRACQEALAPIQEIESVRVKISMAQAGAVNGSLGLRNPIEGVRHVIAVASGKGGVGKSTVAANLAAAFQQIGWKTGLCDCDLYGPSVGLMMGTSKRPTIQDGRDLINPIQSHGIRLMSMSFLVDSDTSAVVLRGPMVTRYTQQFLRNVDWSGLDVLILDLPPGTGDIQLTIVQTVSLTGAIIVTTPQEVALIDARKAATMFDKVHVRVLGLIENMSYFQCPSDGVRYEIFGSGGGAREAERLGVPLLGQIPIEIAAREAGDAGLPITLKDSSNPASQAFMQIATSLKTQLDKTH